MKLPRLIVLTDRHLAEMAGRSLPATVELALEGGAPAILYREKDLPSLDRLALATDIAEMTRDAGATLIVASDAGLANEVEADAVHLAATDRTPASTTMFGRSCHAEDDLQRAFDEGAAFVMLSPVFETASKPGYGPPLGLVDFARFTQCSRLPVYALGGIDVDSASKCLRAGAMGIAVMGAIMRAANPRERVQEMLVSLP